MCSLSHQQISRPTKTTTQLIFHKIPLAYWKTRCVGLCCSLWRDSALMFIEFWKAQWGVRLSSRQGMYGKWLPNLSVCADHGCFRSPSRGGRVTKNSLIDHTHSLIQREVRSKVKRLGRSGANNGKHNGCSTYWPKL